MSKKSLTTFFVGLIIGSVSLSYAAWTGPTQAPPNGNTAAPINISSVAQDKSGVLTVGGLGVFGSALITSSAGYTLPPSLNLGVNGKIGAKQYCDEKGNNCVSMLGGGGGGNTVAVGSSSGGQTLSGWPNGIICNATNGNKKLLPLGGYYAIGRDRYSAKPGYMYGEPGGLISIYFDATTKKSLIVHGNGDYGGNLPQEFSPCYTLGKSISDPAFTWY